MAAYVENRRQHFHLQPSINAGVDLYPYPNFSKQEYSSDEDHSPSSSSSSSSDEEEDDYIDLIRTSNMNDPPPTILDPRDEATSDNWVNRNPTMIRLTGKHPFNSEPPLTKLMDHGFITPVPLHYVRNHGPVPRATWDNWSIEVSGLVKRPTCFTMDQLVNEFPTRELPVTLVCAGNRRKEQNMTKKSVGFNWGSGGVSTSVWKGVPLRAVLQRCGVRSGATAMYVCFEGDEDLPGGGGGGGGKTKYGTSLRKEVGMDPARDVLLAYMQNGELLTPDHGFPVRVIIPGFIGGRMVKWLRRIIVTSEESGNYYHYRDNRVLPSHVDAELANSEGWWYKPECIINELNVNSVITVPSHEEILPINSWTTQKPYTLKGYAYSGGGKKVTRVEVTMDGGDTWRVCELDSKEKPTEYGKYWCWCFWSLDVEVLDLLATKEISVRAWDQSLNTQPEKLIWNLMGMMNNCWFRVKPSICKRHNGEIGIVFEHPTVPGNQSGGWMAKDKHLEITSSEANHTLKKSFSTPLMNVSSKTFTTTEVNQHNSPDSTWIIVNGQVYDCTHFLKDHPGGSDSILINAGTDCTEEFEAIHSDKAKKLLEDYHIGELVNVRSNVSSPNGSVHGASRTSSFSQLAPVIETTSQMPNVALASREKVSCKLVQKESLSHDVRLFRFALPAEDQVLGLPVGKHIFICVTVGGKLCMRAYTPTTIVDAVGHFDLVVKVYLEGIHPKFPNGGVMSQYLNSLEVGSTVDVKGPLGHIEYLGRGKFTVHGKPKFGKKLAMVAGGTGITPIYQVIQAVLRDPEDRTEMYIVYANRTEDDILLRDELDEWARTDERLKVWYVVSKSKRAGWGYSTGFITEGILREHLPSGSNGEALALACGPPSMIQFAVQPNLEKLGYNVKETLLVF
ncbi:Nitrate reductase [NAD(P)H] [Linum perenne]